ncbi:hypothetical protein SAMD00019534_028930 [Acytostelium subglobosum LB1]|uniref:hypothetical protein n=1 Tax=Acytostelium subglobosum LB1 TaxID=1410327 RepID=UPI000644CC3C|nr:hypothetical protein SAMD00019534_028930 [Acytostelium subglobosum LB1]GAM19718.1 hypothetical protein SAMD00019534_028930 [Acytostelium subglobosum LB1]|eukprot:XP_012756480.1 hypothetical protein SAMD00019534_028930 [Acytostelium subglobosum LB1]
MMYQSSILNNTPKLPKVLLPVMVMLVLLLCSDRVSADIDSMSARASYMGGGTNFVVQATGFPLPPVVQLTLGGGAPPVIFPFVSVVGTTYTYTVPAEPPGGDKKRRSSIDFTLDIFNGLVNAYHGAFSYLAAEIEDFDPPKHFQASNGRRLTINGANLKIDPTFPPPTVSIGTSVCALTDYKDTRIQCTMGNQLASVAVPITITYYNGYTVTASNMFDVVNPIINNIVPASISAGQSQVIALNGNFLYDFPHEIMSKITFGGEDCTNIVIVSSTQIKCTSALFTGVPQGTAQNKVLAMTIGAQNVIAVINLEVYEPLINAVLPRQGLSVGGTVIRVTGLFLSAVTAVAIGGSNCVLVPPSIAAGQFDCTTSLYNLGPGINSATFPLVITIDGQNYQSQAPEVFTYYTPVIQALLPVNMITLGTFLMSVQGVNFYGVTAVKIGPVTVNVFKPTSNDLTLLFDVNAALLTVGNNAVTVEIGTVSSNAMNFPVAVPSLGAPVPATGFLHAVTPITLTIANFPTLASGAPLNTVTKVYVNGIECKNLVMPSATQFTCDAPAAPAAGAFPITFKVLEQDYNPAQTYTYYDLNIAGQTQSTTIPAGGGVLTLNGGHLDVVQTVTINAIPVVGCTIGAAQITCPIPRNLPGAYPVAVIASGVIYPSPAPINYIGPNLLSISPIQGNSKRVVPITLGGNNLGAVAAGITITIGGVNCPNVVVKPQVGGLDQIGCDVPVTAAGMHNVVINVVPGGGGAAVASINNVQYRSNGLACLGAPLADDSNSPVEWWFTYKQSHTDPNFDYIYIDNTLDRLVKLHPLSNFGATSTSFSPLAITFDQYRDYHYAFFNDQPGSRDNDGRRSNEFTPRFGHGHLKAFVIFDYNAATLQYEGIHVMHSNPVFPATRGANAYYDITAGMRWIGQADNNQHFFCYPFSSIEMPFNYLIHNDASMYPTFNMPAGMGAWPQATKNRFPFFYDYMALWMGLPQRIPIPPAVPCNQICFQQLCEAAIIVNPNVRDICYWQSPAFMIGGRTANYFMKTSLDTRVVTFPPLAGASPPGLDRFIVINHFLPKKYDGIDIWTVVAESYGRMMFIEMFYKTPVQMLSTNAVINVGLLHLPPYLSGAVNTGPPLNQWNYFDYSYSGKSNEHAKLGFPIYPVVGPNAMAPNNNMFCVGDSNRHNGQGARGGGTLCFQHPTLSYQFSSMVKSYNSITTANGLMQKPSRGRSTSMSYNAAIIQPLKLPRAAWPNDVIFEIRDAINGIVTPKLPPFMGVVTAATAALPVDVESKFLSLRNNLAFCGGPSDDLGNIAPEVSISGYVSDDTFAIMYVAADVLVASICDNVPLMFPPTPCDQNNARRTRITEIVAAPPPPPLVFPATYNQNYLETMTLRTFDLEAINDFQVVQFTDEFRHKILLNPAALPPIQYIIDATLQVPSVLGAYTTRRLAPICNEELAYDVLMSYVYQQSNFPPQAETIFMIDNAPIPNWANGVLYALSKFMYNEIPDPMGVVKTPAFNPCVTMYFPAMPNIETYTPARPINMAPTQIELFYRTAAATWDMMSMSINNGNGARVARVNNADVITWNAFLTQIIALRQGNGITSLSQMLGLMAQANPAIDSPANRQSLINNYLVAPPPVIVPMPSFFAMPQGLSTSSLLASSVPPHRLFPNLTSLAVDPEYLVSPIQQLLQVQKSFSDEEIIYLSDDQTNKLIDSMMKWATIAGVNQAVQVLFTDPWTQTQNQPIQFISELNRDQIGGDIQLCSSQINPDETLIAVCSPMSINAITFFIESAIVSSVSSQVQYGDFNAYFLPMPPNYNGSISSQYGGMAIATINSEICDIQMMTTGDFLSHNFDNLCASIGPVVVNITSLTGPTSGGVTTTINGFRFNSSLNIQMGKHSQVTPQVISPWVIEFQTPAGIGHQVLFHFFSSTILFNIQRTKFYYKYDAPIVTDVSPATLDSQGGSTLTITGSNFGNDPYIVEVTIDEDTPCYPVLGITSTSLACYSPSGVGQDKTVTVKVGGQSSKFTVETIPTMSFDYEAPSLQQFLPPAADAGDFVVIQGDGFGSIDDGYGPPMVFMGDQLLQVVDYTDTYIKVLLDEGVGSNQSVTIQAGDQTSTLFTQFGYLPPLITGVFQSDQLSTSGGAVQIIGEGWGLASTEIDYVRIGNIELNYCNPFDKFVECLVPPGVGAKLPITASVGGQVAIGGTYENYVSYAPPFINRYRYFNNGTFNNLLMLNGRNFFPANAGVNLTSSSYIEIKYTDNSLYLCNNGFVNSSYAQCPLVSTVASIVMYVGGQISNELYISNNTYQFQLFVFNDTDHNGLYNSSIDLPMGKIPVTLTDPKGVTQTFDTDASGYVTATLIQNEYVVYVGPLDPSIFPNVFISINNITIDLSQNINVSIPVTTKFIYGCIGRLYSERAIMDVQYGLTPISNWGFCDPDYNAYCTYVITRTEFPDGCIPMFGNKSVNVRYSTTLTINNYMDNNLTGVNTGIGPGQQDYFFVLAYAWNGIDTWSMTVTPSTNGIFVVDSIPPVNINITFWTRTNNLIPIINRHVFKLPVTKEVSFHSEYFGFYNAFSNASNTLYPATLFSSLTGGYKGDTMSLPLGKYNAATLLAQYSFVNNTRSFFGNSTFYNVYVYTNHSSNSVITGIPTNGVVNLVSMSQQPIGVQFEISSSTLFNFLTPDGPLSNQGQNVTFVSPYTFEQPIYSVDVQGVPTVIPCTTNGRQQSTCNFPANSGGQHTITLTWRGLPLYQTYPVWYRTN